MQYWQPHRTPDPLKTRKQKHYWYVRTRDIAKVWKSLLHDAWMRWIYSGSNDSGNGNKQTDKPLQKAIMIYGFFCSSLFLFRTITLWSYFLFFSSLLFRCRYPFYDPDNRIPCKYSHMPEIAVFSPFKAIYTKNDSYIILQHECRYTARMPYFRAFYAVTLSENENMHMVIIYHMHACFMCLYVHMFKYHIIFT